MTIDMSQFYQVFFEESAEHLSNMERLLLGLDLTSPNMEDLNAIFRAAHSIKGGSGTFGFTDMTEVTHILETLLDDVRKGAMRPSSEIVDIFLESVDVIREQLNGHISGTKVDPSSAEEIYQKLHSFSDQKRERENSDHKSFHIAASRERPSPPPSTFFEIIFRPDSEFIKRPSSIDNLTSELSRLGTLEIQNPAPQPQSRGRKTKRQARVDEWKFLLETDSGPESIQSIFAFIAEPEALRIHALQGPSTSKDTFSGEAYGFFEPVTESKGSGEGYGDPAPLSIDPGYGFFEAPAASLEKAGENGNRPPQNEHFSADPGIHLPQISKASDSKVEGGDTRRGKPPSPTGGVDASIRVSVERVDQLINQVGELVITQAMLSQTAAGLDPVLFERMNTGLSQLERNTRDLQESVMSIRMMQISFVFSRFPRLVHDLAAKLGKQVDLVTIGETTELDKGLIEKIADPLTHLIRNSLDHGIEAPERRITAGKTAKGTIAISASHQGGNVVIEVSDDGAGLDREKILAKALDRGLNVSDAMSDNDVWMLIFEPGFSTADAVTDVSGRGVGMDVVKRNVAEIGGGVQIRTLKGFGTTITIRIPLTLAILDGMSVSMGGIVYLIPLNMIIETLKPQPQDIRTITGQGKVVQVRGEYLPIIALHRLFNMETKVLNPADGVLVLIESEGKKGALLVDFLVGQQQVVIKSLETNFRKIAGISGATIMGDGKVALILDVGALLKMGQ